MPPKAKEQDAFQEVASKTSSRAKVACNKPGCAGLCPLNVVLRSNRADGVPATCQVCGRKYKVPPGTSTKICESKGGGKGKTGDTEVQRELRALKEELKQLKLSTTGTTNADVLASDAVAVDDVDAHLQAELKVVRGELAALRELDPKLHGLIQGGYNEAIARAEATREALLARRRGGLPIKTQLAKAEAFVEFTSKRFESEQAKGDSLMAQKADIENKITVQAEATAAASARLGTAKAERAAIAARIAADTSEDQMPNGDGGDPLHGTVAARQAIADLCTFASNPGVQQALVAAGMPEDQQTRVVAAMGTIATNRLGPAPEPARSATGATTARTARVMGNAADQTVSMELDDELLDEMAEAAVPPAGEGDAAAEDRKTSVAATKARLKSKASDMEARLSKVRKMLKARA